MADDGAHQGLQRAKEPPRRAVAMHVHLLHGRCGALWARSSKSQVLGSIARPVSGTKSLSMGRIKRLFCRFLGFLYVQLGH